MAERMITVTTLSRISIPTEDITPNSLFLSPWRNSMNSRFFYAVFAFLSVLLILVNVPGSAVAQGHSDQHEEVIVKVADV